MQQTPERYAEETPEQQRGMVQRRHVNFTTTRFNGDTFIIGE